MHMGHRHRCRQHTPVNPLPAHIVETERRWAPSRLLLDEMEIRLDTMEIAHRVYLFVVVHFTFKLKLNLPYGLVISFLGIYLKVFRSYRYLYVNAYCCIIHNS